MVYKIKNIDEAFISEDSVRTNYKKYYNWFNNQDFFNLTKKNSEAFKFFNDTGITFKVYSENNDDENLIPFDIVPRIINRREWEKIVKGITQRVIAINLFLNDIYSNQEIINSGIIPISLLKNNSAFFPEMMGLTPPNKIYNHISGIDLIKTEKNDFYVLEDNVRVPSGVSYMIENRDTMMKLFPDLFSKYAVTDNRDYPNKLSKILKNCSPLNQKKNLILLFLHQVFIILLFLSMPF